MKPKKLFHRNFSLMIIGQIISLFGNAILRFALSMYVLDLTGSAAAFGTILAVSMIPTVLLSPVGGIIADRINRRNHHGRSGLHHRRPDRRFYPVVHRQRQPVDHRPADGAAERYPVVLPALRPGQHPSPHGGREPDEGQQRGHSGQCPGESGGPRPGRLFVRLLRPDAHPHRQRPVLLHLGGDGNLPAHPLYPPAEKRRPAAYRRRGHPGRLSLYFEREPPGVSFDVRHHRSQPLPGRHGDGGPALYGENFSRPDLPAPGLCGRGHGRGGHRRAACWPVCSPKRFLSTGHTASC